MLSYVVPRSGWVSKSKGSTLEVEKPHLSLHCKTPADSVASRHRDGAATLQKGSPISSSVQSRRCSCISAQKSGFNTTHFRQAPSFFWSPGSAYVKDSNLGKKLDGIWNDGLTASDCSDNTVRLGAQHWGLINVRHDLPRGVAVLPPQPLPASHEVARPPISAIPPTPPTAHRGDVPLSHMCVGSPRNFAPGHKLPWISDEMEFCIGCCYRWSYVISIL